MVRRRIRWRQRKRCDARIKNPVKCKNGVAIIRGLRCCAWAMPNGRCRVHGGASTGPKSQEGKARVVAARVEGRREWVERRRAEGQRFTAGRKRGDAWVTEAMRERARAEARRLGAGRFTLDRASTLTLLKSARGDPAARAKAKTMLDAQESAAIERDRARALAIVDGWRTELALRRPAALQSVGPDTFAAPADSDPVAKFWRNVDVALDVLGQILGQGIQQGNVRDMRLRLKVATATIKAALAVNKNMLKATRGGSPAPLEEV
jgi:hypothetical protein